MTPGAQDWLERWRQHGGGLSLCDGAVLFGANGMDAADPVASDLVDEVCGSEDLYLDT